VTSLSGRPVFENVVKVRNGGGTRFTGFGLGLSGPAAAPAARPTAAATSTAAATTRRRDADTR
jgi:hypothetical protein